MSCLGEMQEEHLAKYSLEPCPVISPNLVPKLYVCNSSLYHKFYGEEKKIFMLCLSDAGRQSSGGKGQRAASIVEADSLQESAPETCLRSPESGYKYLQSAENQHRVLVAEPKPYPARDRQQEVPAPETSQGVREMQHETFLTAWFSKWHRRSSLQQHTTKTPSTTYRSCFPVLSYNILNLSHKFGIQRKDIHNKSQLQHKLNEYSWSKNTSCSHGTMFLLYFAISRMLQESVTGRNPLNTAKRG